MALKTGHKPRKVFGRSNLNSSQHNSDNVYLKIPPIDSRSD